MKQFRAAFAALSSRPESVRQHDGLRASNVPVLVQRDSAQEMSHSDGVELDCIRDLRERYLVYRSIQERLIRDEQQFEHLHEWIRDTYLFLPEKSFKNGFIIDFKVRIQAILSTMYGLNYLFIKALLAFSNFASKSLILRIEDVFYDDF